MASTTDWNCPESTAAAALGQTNQALDALSDLPAGVRRDHRILIDRLRPHLDRGTLQSRDFTHDLETLVQTFRKIVDAAEYECWVDYGDGAPVWTRTITEDGRRVEAALLPLWEILRHASRTRDLIRAQRAIRQLEEAVR